MLGSYRFISYIPGVFSHVCYVFCSQASSARGYCCSCDLTNLLSVTPSSSVENHLLLATVLSVLKPSSTTSVNPLYMCISSGQPLYNLFRRTIVYLYTNRCVSLQNNHCVSLYINRCVSRQINHCIHLPKNIVCLSDQPLPTPSRSTIVCPFRRTMVPV